MSSSFDDRRTRSASSIKRVGRLASMRRNIVAAVMLELVSARGTSVPTISNSVVLPQPFSGLWIASFGLTAIRTR